MKVVFIDDFFKVNLVNNLVDLLGIDKFFIWVVNIVSVDGNSWWWWWFVGDIFVEIEIVDFFMVLNILFLLNYMGMKRMIIWYFFLFFGNIFLSSYNLFLLRVVL